MAVQAMVTMFGTFSVVVDGSPARIRTKPAQSLLALLCLSPGKALERTHLAADMWDDLDYAVSGNRLRTSLVILKQALLPWDSIDADRLSIRIEEDSFVSDYTMAVAFLKKVRVLQDLDEEIETLHHLLDIIDQPFLVGFKEPWAASLREIWMGHRTTSLLRISQVQEELGFLSEALGAAERVFAQDSFSPQAWIRYLRLMAKSERANEGLAALNSAQTKMRTDLGLEFDADVLAVANQVRHGSIRPSKNFHRFSVAEKTVLIAALENMATTAPDEFIGLLASKAFMASIFQKPTAAFNIVVESMNNATEEIELKVKGGAIRTAITAAFTLSYHEEREQLCQILINEFPEDSEFYHSGMSQLSFLKFEQRDFVTATDLAIKAIFLAKKHRPLTYNRALESSLAACYWHCKQFAEADEIYESLLADLESREDFVSRYNFALMSVNRAFLKSVIGDWTGCHHFGSQARQQASLHGFDAVISAVGPILGCAKVMLGMHGGPQLIIDGLKDNYRMRNTRVVELSLDYACCALVQLGDSARGLAVLDAVTILRDGRLHGRSLAEQSFADKIREEAKGATADDGISGEVSLLDVLLYACEVLEVFV